MVASRNSLGSRSSSTKTCFFGGTAKECARKVLPLNTPTRLYMSGTIRSWIHYLSIRRGPETQKEHREVAQGIGDIFRTHLPIISEALLDD